MFKIEDHNMSSHSHAPSEQMLSSLEVPMAMPTLPDYVEHTNPPPSYEEAIGHQTQTSVNHNNHSNIPPLAYVDIMPRMINQGNIAAKIPPQFDKFSFVIEAANQWLRNNPSLSVWKCETVERKFEKGSTIDMDSMVKQHSAYGINVTVIGIRMWLKRKILQIPPQQIGVLNIIPEKTVSHTEYLASLEHLMKVHPLYRNISPVARGMASHPIYRSVYESYASYDGMKETIAKLNSKLKENPVPGTIISVQSSQIKSPEANIEPDITVYTSEQKNRRVTEILRIFYVFGPPSGEVIGLQEFHPLMKKKAQLTTPATWQQWPELMEDIRSWVINTTGVRVINIHTHDAKISKSLGNAEIVTDFTDVLQETGFAGNDFIKIVRLFYTTGSLQTQPVHDFSSKLFLPVRLGRRLFEGMSQTMSRIEAWLRKTGLPIYNVETVDFKLEDAKTSGAETEKCTWTETRNTSIFYITAIRIYFPCSFVEPSPDRQSNQHLIPANSDCCYIS